MIRFPGGPASGQVLILRRCPPYLRVTLSPDGKFDALDQLDDQADAGESIHAYRRVGEPGWCHIDFSRPRRGAWYRTAEYRHLDDQPPDETLRETDRWRAWCWAQVRVPTAAATP